MVLLHLSWSLCRISLVGIWAASRTEKLSGRKDPGKVVVDEVAGQFIALFPLPFMSRERRWWTAIVAFILFRFFDIVKPYPARRLEVASRRFRNHGGRLSPAFTPLSVVLMAVRD